MKYSCKKPVRHLRFFSLSFLPALLICLFLCQCEKPVLQNPRQFFDPTAISPNTPLWELLIGLGHREPDHYDAPDEEIWIAAGHDLVTRGKATHPETGVEGIRISAYFYCIDCHNTAKEGSSLALVSDPAARLDFLVENEIPLVPGSTFAGIFNRESWYNDDYALKYRLSPAVGAARDSLEKAVELCSKECSQGREPEPWEMDAMMAYLRSLQWTVGDFNITGADLAELKRRSLNPEEHSNLIAELKSKYSTKAPASFGEIPENPETGFAIDREPNPENGQRIFERSCLHCHGAEGASEHYFGDRESTWKELARKFPSESRKSIYGLIRLGTEPEEDKRPYMPNFTKERMSDAQIEDLRSYLEERAGKRTQPSGKEKVAEED